MQKSLLNAMSKVTIKEMTLAVAPHINVGNYQMKRWVSDIRMQLAPRHTSPVNASHPIHRRTSGFPKHIPFPKYVLIRTSAFNQVTGKFSQLRAIHRRRHIGRQIILIFASVHGRLLAEQREAFEDSSESLKRQRTGSSNTPVV